MAPSKHPLNTEGEVKKQNNHLLIDFFKRRRLGRPKKKGNFASDHIIIAKQGPVASVNNKPVMHDASKGKAPPSKVLQGKKARANYSSGEGLEKLTAPVKEWNAGTERALDSNGEKHGLVQFSTMFGIPFLTPSGSMSTLIQRRDGKSEISGSAKSSDDGQPGVYCRCPSSFGQSQ
jgi:hypothetical protein